MQLSLCQSRVGGVGGSGGGVSSDRFSFGQEASIWETHRTPCKKKPYLEGTVIWFVSGVWDRHDQG